MPAAGPASATENDACRSATVQYRIVGADGNVVGADWTSQGGFHQWDTVPGTVEVRLAPGQSVGDSCKYPVSLAEYTAEGSTWYTSGHQTMVDKATVHLTAKDVAGARPPRRRPSRPRPRPRRRRPRPGARHPPRIRPRRPAPSRRRRLPPPRTSRR